MDTTSNTLSRTLHLLAQHPDVQSKLRQELLDANAAEGLSYEELNKLPLLDCVCRETLRVYVVPMRYASAGHEILISIQLSCRRFSQVPSVRNCPYISMCD